MSNKNMKNPCIPHHPRYICRGVKSKYIAKEGVGGTTPRTKTNNELTARVMNHADIHMPRSYVHMSIEAKRTQGT